MRSTRSNCEPTPHLNHLKHLKLSEAPTRILNPIGDRPDIVRGVSDKFLDAAYKRVQWRTQRLFVELELDGKPPAMTRAHNSRHQQNPEAAGSGPERSPNVDGPIDPRAFGLVKAAYGVREALDALSIGRTSLYAAIRRGEVRPVKFGKKTLFYAADLAAFLAKLRTATLDKEPDRERR